MPSPPLRWKSNAFNTKETQIFIEQNKMKNEYPGITKEITEVIPY